MDSWLEQGESSLRIINILRYQNAFVCRMMAEGAESESPEEWTDEEIQRNFSGCIGGKPQIECVKELRDYMRRWK
jgi:hypothetical protein